MAANCPECDSLIDIDELRRAADGAASVSGSGAGAAVAVSAGASSSEMIRRIEARISSIVGSWAAVPEERPSASAKAARNA